jgi:transposase
MERVIGSDVSKARLDVDSLEDGRRLAVGNDAAGMVALADQLGLGAGDLLVMEASGGYERLPHRLLSARPQGRRGQCRAGARPGSARRAAAIRPA